MLTYVTNKVVSQDVAYQLNNGLSTQLYRRKKDPWPTLPLCVKLYELKSLKEANFEIRQLNLLHFGMMNFHIYDPRKVCKKNCDKIQYTWPYGLMDIPEDEKFKNWYNYLRKNLLGDKVGPSQFQ